MARITIALCITCRGLTHHKEAYIQTKKIRDSPCYFTGYVVLSDDILNDLCGRRVIGMLRGEVAIRSDWGLIVKDTDCTRPLPLKDDLNKVLQAIEIIGRLPIYRGNRLDLTLIKAFE